MSATADFTINQPKDFFNQCDETDQFMSDLIDTWNKLSSGMAGMTEEQIAAELERFVVYDYSISNDSKIKVYKLRKQLRPYLEKYFPTKIIESGVIFRKIFKDNLVISREDDTLPAIITLNKNNNCIMREQFIKDGEYVNGLSDIGYYPNGDVLSETNYINGVMHDCDDGSPCVKKYNFNRSLKYTCRYNNGDKHYTMGPAEVLYETEENDEPQVKFFINGVEYEDEEEYEKVCENLDDESEEDSDDDIDSLLESSEDEEEYVQSSERSDLDDANDFINDLNDEDYDYSSFAD